MKAKNKKVIIAMSGGVDSSVATALLKKQGFDVVGIFLRLQKDKKSSENLAKKTAKKIGIPFYVVNAEKEFKRKVINYFLKEYKAGRTPNPCVVCNKEIKFGLLLEKAQKLGADFLATGHYARNTLSDEFFSARGPLFQGSQPSRSKNSLFHLFKGKDENKDQSYFLWQLDKNKLNKVLFPVGNLTKTEVRALAKKFNLPTAKAKESQEVCFISGATNDFLKKYLKTKPGHAIEQAQNRANKIIGDHQGLWFYTIGQRRGVGLGGGGEIYYVVGKDFKKNNLIVSRNKKDLLKKEMFVKNVNFIFPQKFPFLADVKIRYRSNFAKAKILKEKNKIKIKFNVPQRAITPGQSAVFYKGEQLLGGGVIE